MDPEVQYLISEQAERLAMSMIAWMAERDGLDLECWHPGRARTIDTGVLQ